MRSFLLVILGALLAITGCSNQPTSKQEEPKQPAAASPASPAAQASGKLEVRPAQPKEGEKVTIMLELKDEAGKPLSDAEVKAALIMPMGNSEMREEAELKWSGQRYEGTITPSMGGEWNVEVKARRAGQLLLTLPARLDVK
jgi:nitrogen fixation protein FixH